MKKQNEWESWWSGLSKEERQQVNKWLEKNPPPEEWTENKKAWAFTECPRGFFSGKYGNIL